MALSDICYRTKVHEEVADRGPDNSAVQRKLCIQQTNSEVKSR